VTDDTDNTQEIQRLTQYIVAAIKAEPPVSGGPWRRQVRTWEALVGLIAVAGFLILYLLQPISSARDDIRDMKTGQTLLLKTVTDHENRLHLAEDHNIEFTQLKDSRGKRLIDVEDLSKANTLEINRLNGTAIELRSGQTAIQRSVDESNRKIDEGNRKLDDVLFMRKH
jgi:hypothetical protein